MDPSEHTSADAPTGPVSTPPILHLEVLFGPDRGRKIPLLKNPSILGRTADCDVVMEDFLVSRRHLSISWNGTRATLKDLGSLNGTRMAGSLISESSLAPDQTFEIGTTALVFRRGEVGLEVRSPSLSVAVETQPLNPIRVGSAAQSMARVRSGESGRTPASWLARMVSWAVILLVCGGGMILALNLLESSGSGSMNAREVSPKQGGTTVAGTERRARRLRTKAIPQEPGAFLAEAPKTTDERDVALELYRQGMEAGKKENLPEAVTLLEQVTIRYPEFMPPSGEPIGETIDRYKRTIHVSGIIKKAKATLDQPDSKSAELQALLGELETIPATEGEFGGEAVLLADRVRSRIRQISFGISPSASLPPESVKGPTPAEPPKEDDPGKAPDSTNKADPSKGTTSPPVTSPAAPVPQAPEKKPLTSPPPDKTTWAPIRKAYQKGDFKTAVELASELAQLGPLANREEARALVESLKTFEAAYRTAMAAGQKEGKEREALELLAQARKLDASLFGVFQGAIDRQRAEVYLRQARAALKEKKFERVQELVALAHKLGPGLEAARDFQVLVTAQATELLQKGNKATSLAEASLSYRQAATLAGEASATGREALRLLQELSAASSTP